MTIHCPPILNTPADARFDTQAHAAYVAGQLSVTFGTVWVWVAHDDHFHAADTGIPFPPAEPVTPADFTANVE